MLENITRSTGLVGATLDQSPIKQALVSQNGKQPGETTREVDVYHFRC